MNPRIVGLAAVWFALVAAGAVSSRGQTSAGVVIHEWGTFTSLQDEKGNAIGGINTDDEPVPPFVHDVAKMLLIPPLEVPPVFCQGAPSCHPDVTMRLETPVLYVHAPDTFHDKLDVSVAFKGGWLTQFYPQAAATTPGIATGEDFHGFGHLTGKTVGKLAWSGLQLNADGKGPETTAHVWLSPRAVKADTLQTGDGESEKFLFYRGVGHLEAPLQVKRMLDGKLRIEGSKAIWFDPELVFRRIWQVDIRSDGTAAYRTLDSQAGTLPVTALAGFAAADYSAETVSRLRADLKSALVTAGLFDDEADALLNTWELSYFKSPGLRLFFLVPHAWTDAVLPLTVSGAPTVKRVMVGRIELVTPRQRELLAKIAAGPVPDPWTDFRQKLEAQTLNAGQTDAWNDLFNGKRTFASLGFKVPDAYQAYLDLGRFRNALLLEEEQRTGNATLGKFIKAFGLQGYRVPDGR